MHDGQLGIVKLALIRPKSEKVASMYTTKEPPPRGTLRSDPCEIILRVRWCVGPRRGRAYILLQQLYTEQLYIIAGT